MTTTRQIFPAVLSLTLLVFEVTGQPAPAFQDEAAPQTTSQSSTSGAPAPALQTPDQLDALVAPIALYPDALVAQVLSAATLPDQVAIADYWLGQNSGLTGAALSQAVDQQSWDPSVKALTLFPSVLDNMAKNLAWTSSLGQAFATQQADVMAAVQTMRAKARAAGTLQSTPEIKVVQPTPQTIVIQPANPQVVYVPQYNPAVVYGTRYVVPLYSPVVAVATPTVGFSAGIAIGAAFGGGAVGVVGGGGGFSWGFGAWNCNWGGGGGGGGNIIFNHNTYITNNNWHNNNYNGYHPWGPGPHGPGPYGPHPYDPNGRRPFSPYGPNGNHYQPDGGRNGDHGLIGGNGGVQHFPANRPGAGGLPANNPNNEHRDGFQPEQRGNQWANQHDNVRAGGPWADQPRSQMSGNGNRARAESFRGRTSMRPSAPRMHPGEMHAQAPRNVGGGGRRR